MAVGAFVLLDKLNKSFLVTIPSSGGVLTEGIVGAPRFINPLLAQTESDRDLVALIYSGLLKTKPDGTFITDLAENFDISEDGLTYTFTLKDGIEFHDGRPVTADDVIFTIQKAQDPALKSPRRINWEGVAVEKTDQKTIKMTLKQPYAPFLEITTIGILPKHLFEGIDSEKFPFSQKNINAIGSGPFKIYKISKDSSGIPSSIELRAFDKYSLGSPYLEKIVIYFYQNEKDMLSAKSKNEIESMDSLTPAGAAKLNPKDAKLIRTPLPRVFSVFLNQNNEPILAEKNIRTALALSVDKEYLVSEILLSFGVPIDAPIPPFLLDTGAEQATSSIEKRIKEANDILDKAKWKLNEKTGIREKTKGKETQTLSFSLATSDVPELKIAADMLKDMWRKIGADVKVEIFESGDLNQNIIRPRKFSALLFGQVVGRDLDLFAFWHSSQRNDPGLNISGYANSKVDKLLEKARREKNDKERKENFIGAVKLIQEDIPAIFLYTPEFMYLLPNKIKGFTANNVSSPSERFSEIHLWFIETEKVWEIFAKK